MNRPVTSREYKLMLNADRFGNREEGSSSLWELLRYLADRSGGTVKETQGTEKDRTTWYVDTQGRDLARRGYSLRVRSEDANHKITLKLRAADRYLAAAQAVAAAENGEEKFEEDILPPFISKFSHSCSIEHEPAPKWKNLDALAQLFPAILDLGIDPQASLETVNDFRALEIARKVGKLEFDGSTVKVALSFWYLPKEIGRYPFVGELSYDYDIRKAPDDALEDFPEPLVEGANSLFTSIQRQTAWLDLSATTKTAAAYSGL